MKGNILKNILHWIIDRICPSSNDLTPVGDKKMYIILREDLAYKYIQGSHALAQFALDHYDSFMNWGNQKIVYLSVFNGIALKKVSEIIYDSFIDDVIVLHSKNTEVTFDDDMYNKWKSISKVKYSVFIEPDLESDLPTAIAIYDDGVNGANLLVKGLSLATR